MASYCRTTHTPIQKPIHTHLRRYSCSCQNMQRIQWKHGYARHLWHAACHGAWVAPRLIVRHKQKTTARSLVRSTCVRSLRIYWQVISFKYHIVNSGAPEASGADGFVDSFELIGEFGTKDASDWAGWVNVWHVLVGETMFAHIRRELQVHTCPRNVGICCLRCNIAANISIWVKCIREWLETAALWLLC